MELAETESKRQDCERKEILEALYGVARRIADELIVTELMRSEFDAAKLAALEAGFTEYEVAEEIRSASRTAAIVNRK